MYLGSVVDTLAVCWCNKHFFAKPLAIVFYMSKTPFCFQKMSLASKLSGALQGEGCNHSSSANLSWEGGIRGTCQRDLSWLVRNPRWILRHSAFLHKKCHIESESVPLGEVNGQLERGEEICQKVACFRTVLESRMPCFARGCQGQIWKGAFWQAYPWWSVCDPVTFLMGAIETEHNIEMRGLYPWVMLRNHDKKVNKNTTTSICPHWNSILIYSDRSGWVWQREYFEVWGSLPSFESAGLWRLGVLCTSWPLCRGLAGGQGLRRHQCHWKDLKGGNQIQNSNHCRNQRSCKVLQGLAVLLQIGSPPRAQATNIVIGVQ